MRLSLSRGLFAATAVATALVALACVSPQSAARPTALDGGFPVVAPGYVDGSYGCAPSDAAWEGATLSTSIPPLHRGACSSSYEVAGVLDCAFGGDPQCSGDWKTSACARCVVGDVTSEPPSAIVIQGGVARLNSSACLQGVVGGDLDLVACAGFVEAAEACKAATCARCAADRAAYTSCASNTTHGPCQAQAEKAECLARYYLGSDAAAECNPPGDFAAAAYAFGVLFCVASTTDAGGAADSGDAAD